MKIIDENGLLVENVDMTKGYLKDDIITEYHEAVKGIEEQWHYETIAEYPNGGRDVRKIIDVPGVEAVEAWEETIPVRRYIHYTDEELEEIKKSKRTIWDEMAEAYNEGVQIA